MQEVNDFSKKLIQECYEMMLKFVSWKEEIAFGDLYHLEEKISRRRVGIPSDVYEKIISFVEVNLAPLVDKRRFHWCTEEECGVYDYEGNFVHLTQEQKKNYDERCVELFFERLRMVEEFGMRELYPYLTGESSVKVGLDNTIFNSSKMLKKGVSYENRRI